MHLDTSHRLTLAYSFVLLLQKRRFQQLFKVNMNLF